MKLYTIFIIPVILVINTEVNAQKQTYDIVSYLAPVNWTIQPGNNFIAYSRIDGGSWAQIAIYKSTVSKGGIETDSQAEWETLVTSSHSVRDQEKTVPAFADGWHVMSRSGVWEFNGANVASILTTYSNGSVCLSVLCNATAQPYLKDFKKLISTLSFETTPINTQVSGGLITQWDDGWISQAKENWTEIVKPDLKIFIFHPDPKVDLYNSDKTKGDRNAWDQLVLPYFSNISSLQDRGMQGYPSISFLTADATEKQTGKRVHLVLYKKHYDQGNGRYMLVVANSRSVFEKEFGNNYINTSSWETFEQAKSWDKLAAMQWRNRFALSASLLNGKWTSGNSSTLSYYYVGTGGYAGATAVSVADAFTFMPGNKYESDHSGASGIVGNQQFSRQQYSGNYLLNGWKIQLTGRFRGEREEYDGYFEAVKGGVLLVLTDRQQTIKTLVKTN